MSDLTIKELQDYLKGKYKEGRTSSGLFIKLVEEIGEVAEVLNQLEGRKKQTDSSSLENELVDVLHYTLAIASINNIDLTRAIIEKDKKAAVKYNQTPTLEEFIKSFDI